VAARECSEVVRRGVWRVLKEDLMLLLWSEMLHDVVWKEEGMKE
jgi:hypothetical protein